MNLRDILEGVFLGHWISYTSQRCRISGSLHVWDEPRPFSLTRHTLAYSSHHRPPERTFWVLSQKMYCKPATDRCSAHRASIPFFVRGVVSEIETVCKTNPFLFYLSSSLLSSTRTLLSNTLSVSSRLNQSLFPNALSMRFAHRVSDSPLIVCLSYQTVFYYTVDTNSQ